MERLRRLVRRGEGGYTLVELIAVLVILLTVVTALTSLFVSGTRAQVELNKRFETQQHARLAADRLRREVHCAKEILLTSASSITVKLPGHCPTATGGVETNVVYDAVAVTAGRYKLQRAGTTVADFLTTDNVFSYDPPSTASLGRLRVDLPVNANPNEGWKQWRLQTDIVLRNTVRS